MALDLTKPSRIAKAVQRTIRSPAWVSGSEEDKVWLLVAAVCDALAPLVPRWPAVRRELERRHRDRAIVAEFDGRNYAELAVKYNRSTRQVRRIVDGPRQRHASSN